MKIKEIEPILKKKGVTIERVFSFRKEISFIHGTLKNKHYLWNELGHCYHRGNRVPELDINF